MLRARMNHWIFHVDMDAFFVSVERTLDPKLCAKPVIVGGDPASRGVVAAASYEARAYGIHSAMPLSRAKRLCPHALFIRGHYQEYSKVSGQIRAIFEEFTPDVEMVSIDEAYLDLSGFDRLYGPVMDTAERIRNRVLAETQCPASIGIATNKLVAKVASNYAKPDGIMFVKPGFEARFLAPLAIDTIPGIGSVTTDRLHSLGLKCVADITRLGPEILELTMGKSGLFLYDKARGIGSVELSSAQRPKSIGNETTFNEDTVDQQFLASVLSYLTEKATTRLRRQSLRAKCVTLKLRYSDFQTLTRNHTFREPTDLDQEIFQVVFNLFQTAFTRRTRIRLLGVTLSQLVAGPWQLGLPLTARPNGDKWRSVYQKVDEIRARYGFRTLLNAHSRLARQV